MEHKTNISAYNVSLTPLVSMNISGGTIFSEGTLTLNGGNILSSGITFIPEAIEAQSLTSDFLSPSFSINATSGDIKVGNLSRISEGALPYTIYDITLTASAGDVELYGDNETATGAIYLESTMGNTAIKQYADITSVGTISIISPSGSSYYSSIEENALVNASNDITITGGIAYIGKGASINSTINIEIDPSEKLELEGGFLRCAGITINGGDITNNGITFIPEGIGTTSAISSDFLPSIGGNISLVSTTGDIKIGNIDRIFNNGANLNPVDITLTTSNPYDVHLMGDITATGDLTASARDIVIHPGSFIKALNINLDYAGSTAGDSISILGGELHTGPAGIMMINRSGVAIENKTIYFKPEKITANTWSSNFLSPLSDINFNTNYPIEIANLDNVVINNIWFNPSNITLNSTSYVELSGNLHTVGSLEVNAPEVRVAPETFIWASNIELNPTDKLNINGGKIIADNDLTILGGDIINNGITFTPTLITADTLNVSSFFSQNAAFNLTSISDIAIANLDHIFIGNEPLGPTSISLSSSGGSVTVLGDNSTPGNFTIDPAQMLTIDHACLFTAGTLVINSGDITNYGVAFAPTYISANTIAGTFLNTDMVINSNTSVRIGSINDIYEAGSPYVFNSLTINADTIELNGFIDATSFISINPVNKLSINGAGIDTPGALTLNGGNIKELGIDFNPDFINANTLNSDFLFTGSNFDLRSYCDLNFGNLDSITIGGSSLNIQDINIDLQPYSTLIVNGSISVSGDIDLNAGSIKLTPGSNLTATNIFIEPKRLLELDNSTLTASSNIDLSGGKINNLGLVFTPNFIGCDTFNSNFIYDGASININSITNLTVGNVNNITDSGGNFVYSDFNLSSYAGSISILGDISSTNNIMIIPATKIIIDNASINPLNQLVLVVDSADLFGFHFNPASITSASVVGGFITVGAANTFNSNRDIVLGNTDFIDIAGSGGLNPSTLSLYSESGSISLLGNISSTVSLTINPKTRLNIDGANITSQDITLNSASIFNWGLTFNPNSLNATVSFNSDFLVFNNNNSFQSNKDLFISNLDIINNAGPPLNPLNIQVSGVGDLYYLDLNTSGSTTSLTSVGGNIYLGQITATEGAQLDALSGGIIDYYNNIASEIITTNPAADITINARSIGDEFNPLDISLENNFTANAGMSIFVIDQANNFDINEVVSNAGKVYLESFSGSILDANNDGNTNIYGAELELIADSIGAAGDPLEVEIVKDVSATAGNIVNLTQNNNDLNIGAITATVGDITLIAANGGMNIPSFAIITPDTVTLEAISGTITDISVDTNPNIQANDIYLNANEIGSGLDYFDIDLTGDQLILQLQAIHTSMKQTEI